MQVSFYLLNLRLIFYCLKGPFIVGRAFFIVVSIDYKLNNLPYSHGPEGVQLYLTCKIENVNSTSIKKSYFSQSIVNWDY